MIIYSHPQLSPPAPCSYLPDKTLIYEYFFADCLNADELEHFLASGWRKFGHYFFRPACPHCRACTPLRVPVNRFQPSRSQKRVLRACRDIQVSFGPLLYSEELFDLHQAHSQERFGEIGSFENFASNLHAPPCPALLARYELDGQLIAAGYLDHSAQALSSVYFIFDPQFSARSLGVFGALREIEQARKLSLEYYYLGYIVPECAKMTYKGRFYPHELYSWSTGSWREIKKTTGNPEA